MVWELLPSLAFGLTFWSHLMVFRTLVPEICILCGLLSPYLRAGLNTEHRPEYNQLYQDVAPAGKLLIYASSTQKGME